MINTPIKFPSGSLVWIGEVSWLTIKGKTWYIHDFLKTVGNNISASSKFIAAVVACFWYFNNNIFSVITPLAFESDNVSLIQMFSLHTWVLFAIVFSVLMPKMNSYIKYFIENQLIIKSNQIHGFLKAPSITCLPTTCYLCAEVNSLQ